MDYGCGRLGGDSLISSGLVGSTGTIEDSVGSSQFGSQSDSLDDLDCSRDQDPYHGYVPEPTREVSSCPVLQRSTLLNNYLQTNISLNNNTLI